MSVREYSGALHISGRIQHARLLCAASIEMEVKGHHHFYTRCADALPMHALSNDYCCECYLIFGLLPKVFCPKSSAQSLVCLNRDV